MGVRMKHYFQALFMFLSHIKSLISLENRFELDLGTASLRNVIFKRKEKKFLFHEIFKSSKNHNNSSNWSKNVGLVSFDGNFLVLALFKISAQSAKWLLRKLIFC